MVRLEREQLNEFFPYSDEKNPAGKAAHLEKEKEYIGDNNTTQSLSDFSTDDVNFSSIHSNVINEVSENRKINGVNADVFQQTESIESQAHFDHDNEAFLKNVHIDSLKQLLKVVELASGLN